MIEGYMGERSYMKTRDCLYGIEANVIVDLVQNGELVPIICKNSTYASVKNTEPVNGYFKIKDTNLVWMHVQNGYGVIINEYVETESGKRVNLVSELSPYYWYIENRTGIIKAWALDNRVLYRCIESIILYKNIKKNMKSFLEVHHKWWKWCNTQNTMSVVCYKKHQYFHNHINSRKSHQKGIVIRSVKEFMDWKKVIASENAILKNQHM